MKNKKSCLFARISCNAQHISINSGAAGRVRSIKCSYAHSILVRGWHKAQIENYITEYQRTIAWWYIKNTYISYWIGILTYIFFLFGGI